MHTYPSREQVYTQFEKQATSWIPNTKTTSVDTYKFCKFPSAASPPPSRAGPAEGGPLRQTGEAALALRCLGFSYAQTGVAGSNLTLNLTDVTNRWFSKWGIRVAKWRHLWYKTTLSQCTCLDTTLHLRLGRVSEKAFPFRSKKHNTVHIWPSLSQDSAKIRASSYSTCKALPLTWPPGYWIVTV